MVNMTLKCLCLRHNDSSRNLSEYRMAKMHVNKNYVDYSDSETAGSQQQGAKKPSGVRVIGGNDSALMSFDEGKNKKKMKLSQLNLSNLKMMQRGRSIKRRLKQSYSIDSLTSLEKINAPQVNYDFKTHAPSITNLNSRYPIKSLSQANSQAMSASYAKKSSVSYTASPGANPDVRRDSKSTISKHPNLSETKLSRQTGSVNKGFISDERVSSSVLDLSSGNRLKQSLDNDAFKKILVDFNLSNDKIESLMKLPAESKLKMYNSYLHQAEQVGFKEESIEVFVESLQTLITSLALTNHSEREIDCFVAEDEARAKTDKPSQSTHSISSSCSSHLKRIENLKLVLKSSPLSFVVSFSNSNGFELLLNLLNTLRGRWRLHELHANLIMCIKALMNNSKGRESVLTSENAIKTIIQSLHQSNTKVKIHVLEILSAVCFLDKGHGKVLKALDHLSEYSGERARFMTVISCLDNQEENDKAIGSKNILSIASMSFINSLICCGAGEKNLDFRLHVRYELLMQNIQAILERLKGYNNCILDKHIQYFESRRYEDEQSYACLFDEHHRAELNSLPVGGEAISKAEADRLKYASQMFELISKRLMYSTSFTSWLSILYHLLLSIVKSKIDNGNFWSLINDLIQQIVLQAPDGKDLDKNSIKFDFNKLLANKSNQGSNDKDNEDRELFKSQLAGLRGKLEAKEKQFDCLLNEKELLVKNVNKLRNKYEEEKLLKEAYEKQLIVLSEKCSRLEKQIRSSSRSSSRDQLDDKQPETPRKNNKTPNTVFSLNSSGFDQDLISNNSLGEHFEPKSSSPKNEPRRGEEGGHEKPELNFNPSNSASPVISVSNSPTSCQSPSPSSSSESEVLSPKKDDEPEGNHRRHLSDYCSADKSTTPPSSTVPASPSQSPQPPPSPPAPEMSQQNPNVPVPPPMPNKGFSYAASPQIAEKRNAIPKASLPMKCFNWTKIAVDTNLNETIWKSVNDESVYKIIDLDDFQRTFSAYQPRTHEFEPGHVHTLMSLNSALNSEHQFGPFASLKTHYGDADSPESGRNGAEFSSIPLNGNCKTVNNSKLKKEFSVIDSRRARNCAILLSKLKLSNEELANIILNMDQEDQLPKDMIEQLLKFVPTAEEAALLEQNQAELANMAKADRFLYDMSKLFHYKQKLECLNFKKKYAERYKEISIKVEAIIECCRALTENKNIVKLFEIILAMGNYMNQGQKFSGIALGFSVANLNKLIDIKSSSDKTYSMLHFLINTVEVKMPEILSIYDELQLVIDVSKINLESLMYEWKLLESGFVEFRAELASHKSNEKTLRSNDNFATIAEEFFHAHQAEIEELRKNVQEMNSEYVKTIKYFGENESRIKFEDFFQMWSTFLMTFHDVKQEMSQRRRRSLSLDETVKLRAKPKGSNSGDQTSLASTTKAKNPKLLSISENAPSLDYDNDEFDSLVSAIVSGNVYKTGSGTCSRRRTSLAHSINPDRMQFQRERGLSLTDN